MRRKKSVEIVIGSNTTYYDTSSIIHSFSVPDWLPFRLNYKKNILKANEHLMLIFLCGLVSTLQHFLIMFFYECTKVIVKKGLCCIISVLIILR